MVVSAAQRGNSAYPLLLLAILLMLLGMASLLLQQAVDEWALRERHGTVALLLLQQRHQQGDATSLLCDTQAVGGAVT